jgi:hypothetical protein
LRREALGAQGAQYLVAVHLRHGQVEQYYVAQALAYGIHGLAAIDRLGD